MKNSDWGLKIAARGRRLLQTWGHSFSLYRYNETGKSKELVTTPSKIGIIELEI